MSAHRVSRLPRLSRTALAALGLAVLAGCASQARAPAAAVQETAAAARPLLFISNRSGNAQIHRINPDGSGDVALTQGPAENNEPAWSPDGRQIAFTSYRNGNAEIYVMAADGSQQRRLTDHALADNAPVWTPDGRIVFRSMRDRWANFYVMNADGSGLRALTRSTQDKGTPVLSPDGRWIAFVVHGDKGSAEIQVMPAEGGEPRDVTSAWSKNGKSFPSWSPDSQRLAYVESQGITLNVRAVRPDGSGTVKITDNAYTNAFPMWSPDGQRIAFVSSREGTRTEMARGDIFVMNADGSGAVNLTRHPDEDNYPAWSADGRRIYFVSLRDGHAQLYAVPAAGGAALRITHSQGFDLAVRPQLAAAATQPSSH